MSTNPFIIIPGDSDGENDSASQERRVYSLEFQLKKMKFELMTNELRINKLQTENSQLRYRSFTLENQVMVLEKELDDLKIKLAELEIEKDKKKAQNSTSKKEIEKDMKKTQSSPLKRKASDNDTTDEPKKYIPLKYFIEKFNKHVEHQTLMDYFKKYGNVKMIIMKEKGLQKLNKEFSSAILHFNEIFIDNLCELHHELNHDPMIIRNFIPETDDIKRETTGWSDEEDLAASVKVTRQFPSPTKIPRCHRSPSPVIAPKAVNKTRSPIVARRRSPTPIKQKLPLTRSILVRGPKFSADGEKVLATYFAKFGRVYKVTILGVLKFVKFYDYNSVAKAMEKSLHSIDGRNYEILAAKDI